MGTDNKLQIIIEAVNKTKGELDQIKDQVNDLGKGIKEAGSHTDSFTGGIGKMAAAFGIANIGMAVLQKGVSEFVSIIKKGLSAVEDFQLSIIENASVITTFAKNTEGANIADVYKNAKEYATNLVNKIEEWDAKTIATGKDLGIINQTLIQGGVLIDYTNKKQEEGFLAIANAVKILTAGQNFEIQGRQEVRALLDGEVRANSRLATLMDAQLNGSLKEQIAIWKQEGTVIEHIGELLSGFAQGANDLETTWTAVGSTLETIATKILRGAFGPVFEDLVGRAKELSDYFLDHKEVMEEISSILSEGISATWITIRNTVQDVYNLLVPLAPLLGLISSIVGTSVTGWSYILAILGPITERVGNLLSSMLEVAKAGYMVYEALYRAASFDFKGAANALGSAKDAWMNAGKQAGKAVSAGLYNEINVKMQELYGAGEKVPGGTKTTPTRPALRQPEPSGTKDKKGKDRTEAFGQTQIELQGELEALNAGFSEYEKAYIQFRTKIDKDKERFKTVPGATDFLTNILGKYDEALYNKYLTQAEQKAKERMDKESVAEVEAQQKLIDVKLDYDSKYNAELLKRHDITEEEAANRSIAIEVKKLESAQAVVAVKQSTAKTDAEANTLAGEYLLIEDKIINTKKIGVFLSEEAAKKDKEQFLDLLISYQQNNLEVAKIVGSLQEEATIQMGILELQKQKAVNAAIESGATKEYIELLKQVYNLKIGEAGKGLLTGSDASSMGFIDGLRDITRQIGTEYEQWKTLTKTTLTSMKSAFSDVFFNVLKGDFNNFGQIWDRFLDGLYRGVADKWSGDIISAFKNMWNGVANESDGWLQSMLKSVAEWVKQVIAQLLAVKAAGSGGGIGGWLAGIFGGSPTVTGEGGVGTFEGTGISGIIAEHKGGFVPKYHFGGGLERDEKLLIGKVGEYMLSKEDVDFVNKVRSSGPSININMSGGASQKPTIVPMGITVMVDNASSAMLQASSRTRRSGDAQYIIDVVLKDINTHGRLARLGG